MVTTPWIVDVAGAQSSIFRQRAIDVVTGVWATTLPRPFPVEPSIGTWVSAVPWMWSTEIGSGCSQGTICAPATDAIAANTSVSQASRWAIIAPFDMPVTWIRRGSIAVWDPMASTTAVMNATSSIPCCADAPQQVPAFQARPSPSG